jgi:integrase
VEFELKVGSELMAKIDQLTDALARQAPLGMHLDGRGLYLQVTAAADGSLSRSWVLRYATGRTKTSATGKVRREERNMGLGSLAAVSLAQARTEAAKQRALLSDGHDPIEARATAEQARAQEERRQATRAMTFDRCAADYITDHLAGWSNPKHADQWRATLKAYASPVLGKLAVQAIETAHVMKVLRPIWTTVPETASRVRGRVEAVLSWATAHGYRSGENPARWQGHLANLLPARSAVRAVRHHAALGYGELPGFMETLRGQGGTSARALEYAILTAARSGEVLGARWGEVDLQARVWVVPADRMKGKREHRVPLCAAALAVLEVQAGVRENDHVFAGGRRDGLSDMALLMTLRRLGRGDLTAHGFRSTFRDWAGNETSFARELAEAALAHVIGDKAEQAYRRSDALEKRRKLMDAWGAYCCKTAVTAKVVPLRA